MRIAIIALGSRGDVEPYIALGKGLSQDGHTVRLVTHENFEALVCAHGLEFWCMRGNIQDVAQKPEMKALLEKGNFFAMTLQMAKEAKQAALHWAEDGYAACQGMDLLIAGMGGLFMGVSLAEKLNVPLLQAHLIPFTPTRAFPSVLLPASVSKLGATFNRLSHQLTRQALWQGSRGSDQTARQQVLGLPKAPFFGPFQSKHLLQPTLYGFSPAVIPKPTDWANTTVTGYWFLEPTDTWTPPQDLVSFLEAGPPPLYIGFGSMTTRNPVETIALITQALNQTQQRAVLLAGWSGMSHLHLPDNIFMVDSIPHGWLFPRVSAVIHHGGAGTTAAGLRAGVPTIITPFFGDQPFWGHRVATLGVGTAPIPHKTLHADQLAQAIRTVTSDSTMRQRAAQLGETIRAENGVQQAVSIVRQVAVSSIPASR